MLNTPTTYSIYMAGLCLKWLKGMGGVGAMEKINLEKAALLYDLLDESRLFKGVAEKPFRSRMNVTFRTGDEAADAAFVKEAAAAGLINLKGPPLGGRHARQHLQRHARRRRAKAGRLHETV
jgi:phosphoserine aminotransferase